MASRPRLTAIANHLQTTRSAWKALDLHFKKVRGLHLRDLFANDPARGEKMAAEGAGIYLDYSKNRVTNHTLKLLIDLAEESGLQGRIDAMFRGEKVNITEKRPALHIALRAPRGTTIFVDGKNVVLQVHIVLEKMARFCNRVRSGEWVGYTGKRIRDVVNIGIGGAHLGPLLAYETLKCYSEPSIRFHFVSNIDGSEFVDTVRDLDPSETLFIICSDTFTTLETMANASSARAWLLAGLGGDEKSLAKHLIGVSANAAEMAKFGIESSNMFEFWDWVGTRYSMGSAVGLSTMLAIGPENFRAMLDGFHQMDMHYLTAPFERNLPVLMGLLAIWYSDLFGIETTAIFPYSHYLRRLPSYLQQLIMGSTGKDVTVIGTDVTQKTGPICWGEVGSDGQHSFFQLLQQGKRLVHCDFIGFAQPLNSLGRHYDILLANLFAQTEALAFGKTIEQVKLEGTPDWLVPHRLFTGNCPSNTILFPHLTPETLGKLIALYEHSVYTQGVIWNINPFDQWGVELGQELAEAIIPQLESSDEPELEHDSSTNALIRRCRALRQTV